MGLSILYDFGNVKEQQAQKPEQLLSILVQQTEKCSCDIDCNLKLLGLASAIGELKQDRYVKLAKFCSDVGLRMREECAALQAPLEHILLPWTDLPDALVFAPDDLANVYEHLTDPAQCSGLSPSDLKEYVARLSQRRSLWDRAVAILVKHWVNARQGSFTPVALKFDANPDRNCLRYRPPNFYGWIEVSDLATTPTQESGYACLLAFELAVVGPPDDAALYPEPFVFGPGENLNVHIEFAGDLAWLSDARDGWLPPWRGACDLLQTDSPVVREIEVQEAVVARRSDCGRIYAGEVRPFRVVFTVSQGDGAIRSDCQNHHEGFQERQWHRPPLEIASGNQPAPGPDAGGHAIRQ
jgi:hypothetical protein